MSFVLEIEVLVVFKGEFGLRVVLRCGGGGWSLKLGDFFLEIRFLGGENGDFAKLAAKVMNFLISRAGFRFLSYKHRIRFIIYLFNGADNNPIN